MKKLVLISTAILFLCSCAAQTYHVNDVPINEIPTKPSKTQWDHFFIAGIGQEAEHRPEEICGGKDKVIKVQSQLTFINWFASALGMGVYSPRTSKVWCKD